MATNGDRLTTAKVMSLLAGHLQYHENKLDSKIHNHQIILFGEKGDDGMCADVRDIKKGYSTMKGIGIAILITLIGNMVMLFAK